jgi:glycosyltransferase involved in cell wall biosynthesis
MRQHISVVIPIYQAENTIEALVSEIVIYFQPIKTANDHEMVISEVLLVHDCGPDRSDIVINQLAQSYPQIKVIWLTRNFGQHAATLAGMSSATGDWIVTIDEDGQHNPANIPLLIDHAIDEDLQLVYAQPTNKAPHGLIRNFTSRLSKRIIRLLLSNDFVEYFHSYRLIRGDVARSLAAYCGQGVFLDVGLLWVAGRIGRCPIKIRPEGNRRSGYTYNQLLKHFWRMLLTVGTRPLRLITLLGFVSVVIALFIGSFVLYKKISGEINVQGWASIVIAISFFSGCILISLGMIAEYLTISIGASMGKPLYVISNRSIRSLK